MLPSLANAPGKENAMLPIQVALTSLSDNIRISELARVAAALQTQVTRDFGPVWRVDATIGAFPFELIPPGSWPIIVHDVLDEPGAAGIHRMETDDTPYALVLYGDTWSLAASHELLEMLADPSASRKIAGASPIPGQGRADYLLEVCGPCEDIATAYSIDGVIVSDFCAPDFFKPFNAGAARYSLSGAIKRPLQVLPNGSLSWIASDGLLYQMRADEDGEVEWHGGFSIANRDGQSLREFVNALRPDQQEQLSNADIPAHLIEAEASSLAARGTTSTRFRDELAWRFGYAPRTQPHRFEIPIPTMRDRMRPMPVPVQTAAPAPRYPALAVAKS